MRSSKLSRVGLLFVILIIALGSGCGRVSVGSTSVDSENEPIEISVAMWNFAESYQGPDPLLKQLEEKLNIRIKPIPITDSDYIQQYQIWASSGNLPDIFAVDAVTSEYLKNWIAHGVIRPLPQDLSEYPNLGHYLSSPDFQYLKQAGQFYSIPRQSYENTDYNVLDRIVAYRWDLAQQAGIKKEPETWEEFKTMLAAIVKMDPEQEQITGLTSVSNILIGGLFWLYSNPVATSDGSGSDFKWILENGQYIPATFSKNALPSLQIIRDFYDAGLIDPELMATRGMMAYDKFANGKTAALLMSGTVYSLDKFVYHDRWLKQYPEDRTFYDKVKLLKPLKSVDGKQYHAVFKSYWSESYISANVDDKKLKRILQLFDFMNTSEFQEMRHYGQLDIDYVKQGNVITSLHPGVNIQEKYKQFSAFAYLLDWDGMFKMSADYSGISPEAYQAQQELLNYSVSHTTEQSFNSALTYMSTPTKDRFKILDYEDMIRVMMSKEPVEKVWAGIVAEYRAKGLVQMIDEVNARMK